MYETEFNNFERCRYIFYNMRVLCKLTSIRYHVFIHFYRTVSSSFPFMFDICLIYGYLRIKSSYFNPASERYIKQLLDEVEHDIMNYQNRGLCYLPKPKADADNTDTRF